MFQSMGQHIFKVKRIVHGIEGEFTCNLVTCKLCNCKNYLKLKICCHLLAAEFFTEKDETTRLVNLPKRGREKKIGKALEKE